MKEVICRVSVSPKEIAAIGTPLKYNELLATLGECYLKQEKYNEAMNVLEKALSFAKKYNLKEQMKRLTFKISYC